MPVATVTVRNQDRSGNMTIWKGITIEATKIKKMNDETLVFVLTRAQPAIAENKLIKIRETAVIIALERS